MSDNTHNHDNNHNASLPPAGWYPDPQGASARRYWDGAQWTDHVAPTSSEASSLAPAAAPAIAPVVSTTPLPTGVRSTDGQAAGVAAVAPRRGLSRLKWWQWALVALAALVLVGVISGAIRGAAGGSAADDRRAAPASSSSPVGDDTPVAATPTSPPVEKVDVPNLVGSTVGEARASLAAIGLTLVATDAGDDWIVTSQQPARGSHPREGLELSITAEAPKPVYTLPQKNAIAKAQSYLRLTGFSRTGLIGQLEYEGFSTEDATFGADNSGADWNAECAEKAQSYLDLTAFSRDGLYDQLAYEGFTDAEIQFGLAAVGY
jgi:hypothetical protein